MYWSLKFVERKGIRITGKQKHCCQPVMVMWDTIFSDQHEKAWLKYFKQVFRLNYWNRNISGSNMVVWS